MAYLLGHHRVWEEVAAQRRSRTLGCILLLLYKERVMLVTARLSGVVVGPSWEFPKIRGPTCMACVKTHRYVYCTDTYIYICIYV